MPIRAPRICCGFKIAAGVRCMCQRKREAKWQSRRPSASQRGYDNNWALARRDYLHKHPRCAMCDAAANVVDHRIPHRGDMKLFWDKSNWQSLCSRCHSSTKQRIERAS